jgi:hypothetical protein
MMTHLWIPTRFEAGYNTPSTEQPLEEEFAGRSCVAIGVTKNRKQPTDPNLDS